MRRRFAHLSLWLLSLLLISLALPLASLADPDDVGTSPPEARLGPTLAPAPPSGVPGAGFVPPPMDWSHLRVDQMPAGLEVSQLPARFDWRERGIVTRVQDQGACGSCYAFAFLASLESTLQIDGAGAWDFSENHAKECNWEEANNFLVGGKPLGSCDQGNFTMMTSLYSQQGTVADSCNPYVPTDVPCGTGCPGLKTVLGWRQISGNVPAAVDVIKGYLYNNGPLATTLYAGQYSWQDWTQEFSGYDGSYTLHYSGSQQTNHAVLIVGWDDSLAHAGGTGGWIVKNSWGTGWGGTCGYGSEKGYFTIAYGSANIGTMTGYPSAWQNYNPAGGLWLHDEAGVNQFVGFMGQTTAWGLTKFTAPYNTSVTAVEFWTTDLTSDIDVYLYDSFDGNRLGNVQRTVANLAFGEAGYFSVPVQPALQVAAGAQVVAVVKFTNRSFTYPVPVDERAPSVRGLTFYSNNGATGSWKDAGTRFDADVGIRVRTTGAPQTPTPTPSPTASPTFKPFTPVAWQHLPVILKKHYKPPVPTPQASPTATTAGQPTATLSATPTSTSTVPVGPTPTPTATQPSEPAATGVFSVPSDPYSLALDPLGLVYVGCYGSNNVALLYLPDLMWLDEILLPEGVKAVRSDTTLHQAYASYGDPLYALDGPGVAVLGVLDEGAYSPSELCVNSANGRIYVADWSVFVGQQDRVVVYSGIDGSSLHTVNLGTTGSIENIAVAVNRQSGLAYAAWTGDARIAVIGTNGQIQQRIAPSDLSTNIYDPWMAINPVASRLYLRGNTRTVVIDLASHTEIGTIDRTGLIAVDEVRNLVYIQSGSKIYVYDGTTRAKLREIALDKYRYVTDIAVDAATRRVFLAAPNDDEIVVVAD